MGIQDIFFPILPLICDERPAVLSQIFKCGEVSVEWDGFSKEYLRNSSSVIHLLSFIVPSAADYLIRGTYLMSYHSSI